MKNKRLEQDVAETKTLMEDEDLESLEELDPETPEVESIIDIYSFSTQDLITKYNQLVRRYNESGDESLRDLAELIEVELAKNGYEIDSKL